MKNFHIVVNDMKDNEAVISERIKSFLSKHGAGFSLETITREDCFDPHSENLKEKDCVITLGGDGTFIQVASKLSAVGIPVLGVNLGRVGYLTEVEPENLDPALLRLLENDFEIENRMMLKGICPDETEAFKESIALNDIVVSRYGRFRAVQYEIYVNDRLLNSYAADGIIISTPTGSTGYNLSAGGPIVEPTADLILVNPVCPHTLNTRAIVLSGDDVIRIKVKGSRTLQEYEAMTCSDGRSLSRLRAGDEILIKRADYQTRFIRLSKESFLNILSRKMNGFENEEFKA